MDLKDLTAILSGATAQGELGQGILGLAYSSKTIKTGELFFCLRGMKEDGHQFAPEAVQRGAIGLVVEDFLPISVPQIRVADTRTALSRVGRYWFDDPASRLGLVGITGTNGKTTTAFLIQSVLATRLGQVGLIGTVCNQLGGPPEPSRLTTPESLDLWRMFDRAHKAGCQWLVMEVSSHALVMGRVDPADFDVAVVLNITRDHFEFHGGFAHYRASKERLVRELAPQPKGRRPKVAILYADDPEVASLKVNHEVPTITFGLSHRSDIFASNITSSSRGSQFQLHVPGFSPTEVSISLPGRYNVVNALAAAAVCWQVGLSPAEIVAGLAACKGVPGRGEWVDVGQPFQVLVDFAHNPDALAKVLSIRPESPGGRVILVFGAEGGKDRGKRPQMGAAARAADYVIVTSDNTATEDPEIVAAEIVEGLIGHPHEVELERGIAIQRALSMAGPGDLVIIAGKGDERTWVYRGECRAFDDREVVRDVLQKASNVILGPVGN